MLHGTKANICLVSYVFVYFVGVAELFKITSRIYSVYLTNLRLSWGNYHRVSAVKIESNVQRFIVITLQNVGD